MGRFKKIIPIIVFVLLTLLTILAIRICYGEYFFDEWPWFKFSVIISLLTCLWPYAFLKYYRSESEVSSALFYAVFILPIETLLFLPEINKVGINLESNFYNLLIALGVIHGLGFFIIWIGLKKEIF